MSFVKKSKRVKPGHKLWHICNCEKCQAYSKQVILDCRIALSILKAAGF